MKIRVNKKR